MCYHNVKLRREVVLETRLRLKRSVLAARDVENWGLGEGVNLVTYFGSKAAPNRRRRWVHVTRICLHVYGQTGIWR